MALCIFHQMVLHCIQIPCQEGGECQQVSVTLRYLSSHHATSAAPVEGGEVVVRMLSELGICEYILKYHLEEISW